MLYIGLLVSLFLDYVRPGAYIGIIEATKIGTIIPLLVLALSLTHKGPITNGMIFRHANTKWLLFLLFLLQVSIVISDVTFYSVKVFKGVFGFVIWYYIIARNTTSVEKLKGVFYVLTFSHIIVLALNPAVVLEPESRSYVFGNPFLGDGNDFALSICSVLPLSIYLFQSAQKRYLRVILIGVMLGLGLAVIGTQSRGATLALAILFFYMWWYGRQKILGMLVILLAIFVLLLYAPPQYFDRMDTIRSYEEDSSAQTRIFAWKAAIRMALAYPITGVGSGHFPISVGRFQNEFSEHLTAHSMYFLILGELGFPGILFLLWILLSNFFRNRKRMMESRASPGNRGAEEFARLFFLMNGSLIAFSVAGAFLSVTYYPHLYLLTALSSVIDFLYRIHRTEVKGSGGGPKDRV